MAGAILALDLGTSAFKCGLVVGSQLVGEAIEQPYELDYGGDSVVLNDPERYATLAKEGLAAGAHQARMAGVEVYAIGVCSQAQTFVTLNASGFPTGPAVVWLDQRASTEAEELDNIAPTYEARTGFARPSAQQFLPKVLHEARRSDCSLSRFLLLNEFVIERLTGHVYGDSTLQGMGGFYEIEARSWNKEYLRLAGIRESQLAPVYPAATFGKALSRPVAKEMGLSQVPIYSCGNDQCCSAIGAGLRAPGEAVCNFGTAMVVYTVRTDRRTGLKANQVEGIDPLSGGYFRLGFTSECGLAVERLRQEHFPDVSIDEMIRSRKPEVNALLDRISSEFGQLIQDLGLESGSRFIATGGLSRSDAWLQYLERSNGIRFERAAHEHTSLLGIAEVILKNVRAGREV